MNEGCRPAHRGRPASRAATLPPLTIDGNTGGRNLVLRAADGENTISGVVPPRDGRITFGGRDITGWRADRVAGLGLVQVPEGRQVLAPLSVEENLLTGAYTRHDREVRRDLDRLFDRFPRLRERRDQLAGSLSGGEQQMLAIARGLMARPRLLMLDEPSLGLAPLIVREVFQIVQELKEQGSTILLVEQNARKALEVADYAYVLEGGAVVQHGPAASLRDDPRVVAAYLGHR